jgi:PAS domain S-box-containing protein
LRKQEILRAAFLDVGRHLSTARVPKEAARIVLEIAFQLWGWDACFLHLYCPEEDVCTYVLNMDTVEGQRVEVPQSDPGKEPHPIFRRVMREGARLILRPEDETPVALVPFGNTERPSASLMFVPLRNAQRIAGIISLQSYRPHAYDKEALQAFQALADHCAGALERIYAEEALRRSEERFQTVARATNDALWEWDLLQNEGWSNETFYALFGCHRKDSGPGLERWYDRIHPEDKDRVLAGIRKLLDKGGETWADEYRFRRADGSYAHVFDRACVVRDGSGKPLRMLGAMMDVTNHKQAEKAMRQFPLRIIEAQERERRRVAHELHDEIGQILTGLKLTMEAMERVSSALAKPHLQQAQGLVNDLIVNVRNLSLDLRPSMLDDLGLLPTFLWYFDRYTAQTGVQVSLTHEGIEARRFGPAAETAAYRIVQEALTNVARHAGVQKASVILWASDEMLQVQVRDSGCGFDPGVKMTAHRSSGLHGMLERAKWLGGDVAVESAPGAGATIAAELPLTPQTDEEEPADAHD